MAEDETGWSEKGKSSRRDKRPAQDASSDAPEATSESTPASKTPTRPSKRETASTSSKRESSVVRTAVSDTGARKVARAAATAGQRDVSFLTRLGFPALIAAICLAGIITVFFAWNSREARATPQQGVDHWHAVYGIYDCTQPGEDKYLPQFLSSQDATGIHSHGDGLIHVHPFFEESSGDNAQLRHFFDEMGVVVTDDSITLDNGRVLAEGAECADGSGPAELRVLHWDFDFEATADARPDPAVTTEDFGQIRFVNDREVYIIAFAAAGTDDDIPPPPADRFEALNNASASLEYNPDELIPRDSGIEVEGDDTEAEADSEADE